VETQLDAAPLLGGLPFGVPEMPQWQPVVALHEA
jgi:hypothetical protein